MTANDFKIVKEEIISKFGNEYNVNYDGISIEITKNNMYPIKLHIQFGVYGLGEESFYIDIDNFGRIREKEDCLSKIEEVLSRITNNVNTYFDFLHNILDELDSRETGFDHDYFINNGNFYLKNKNNKRIINISPKFDLNDITNNDKYIELLVKYTTILNNDKNLMNIYIPAANISDTVDALLFFLD